MSQASEAATIAVAEVTDLTLERDHGWRRATWIVCANGIWLGQVERFTERSYRASSYISGKASDGLPSRTDAVAWLLGQTDAWKGAAA